MGATVTRGTTFTTGQQNVTVATFVPVLTSATIVHIDRANILSSESTAASRQGSAIVAPYASEVRQGNRHNEFQSYLSAIWAVGQLGMRVFSLDLNSGAVTAGDMLMPSQTVFPSVPAVGTLFKAATSSKYSWCAVATENTAPGATSMALYHGPAKVRISGTVVAGHALIPSATDALVLDGGALGVGYGPQVLGVALTADDGAGNVWMNLRK